MSLYAVASNDSQTTDGYAAMTYRDETFQQFMAKHFHKLHTNFIFALTVGLGNEMIFPSVQYNLKAK